MLAPKNDARQTRPSLIEVNRRLETNAWGNCHTAAHTFISWRPNSYPILEAINMYACKDCMSFSLARTRKQQRKTDQKSTDIHPPCSQQHQWHFGQAVLEKWGSTFSWMCIMIQPNVSEDFPETPDVSQEKFVFRSTSCSTQSRVTYKVGGDWEKLIFVSSPLLTEGFHYDNLQCSPFLGWKNH